MSKENKADKIVKRFVLYTVATGIILIIGLYIIGLIGMF